MISCPQCNVVCKIVQVTSHYGQPFTVEQCSACGGVWFDKYEHHRVAEDQVQVVDSLDETLFASTQPVPDVLHCPKDGAQLQIFTDPHFPKDIVVEECRQCGGLWFNRGEFAQYREYYRTRWPKKEPAASKASLVTKAFLQLHKTRDDQERALRAEAAFGKESLKSLITFLVTKPVGVFQSAMLYVLPLWVLVTKSLDTSGDHKVYIDLDEFKSILLEEEEGEANTQE